ncbi:hypothetical protein FOL47_010729 [Perkinsus chesapeaki]|uniref:Uncharacterized protein n=1 Tax=Perkinsus chesapeaki TaxID=330153 RepID=A0A7J6L0R8_PERCH|nr:hypothetical protein FOL47_010729 [Perkinsus chesapeaki]
MVYDCTHRESFDNIDSWLSEVNRYANDSTVKILIGNKSDLEDDQQVTAEEGEEKAKALGFSGFILTSAKDSSNVEKAFSMVSQSLIDTRAAEARNSSGEGGRQPSGGNINDLTASTRDPRSAIVDAAREAYHTQHAAVELANHSDNKIIAKLAQAVANSAKQCEHQARQVKEVFDLNDAIMSPTADHAYFLYFE